MFALEWFFSGVEKNLNGLDRQADRERYLKVVQANAKATREQVLKHLMIRRTRSEIVKYYGDDLHLQGFRFPNVADPEALFYKLSKSENEIFFETVRLLTKDFIYARYKPLTYYEGAVDEQQKQSGRNLGNFMKILLVKRLESSFYAFRLTLARFISTYGRVIDEFQKGHVYISKKHINKVFYLLETDDQEGIDRLLESEKAQALPSKEFSAPRSFET